MKRKSYIPEDKWEEYNNYIKLNTIILKAYSEDNNFIGLRDKMFILNENNL
jgi:hypothetical protein